MGFLIVLVTSLQAGGLGALAFGAYALAPYLLLLMIGRLIRDPWIAGGAGMAALATEIGIRLYVFVYPRGSTAAITLVFSPVFIATFAVPAGALFGYVSGWAWRRSRSAIRSGIALVWCAVFGLTVLGFARPELFPTAVAHRHAVLARIGDARVVTGGDAFETRRVSERSAWYATGELQDAGREEI